MNSILDLLTENNITLHLVSKGDDYCEANGEETYINSSYSDVDNIWLGIYDDPELKNLSLCHEIAHCLIEGNMEFENVYELEKFTWEKTFKIAENCDLHFSKNAIKWGKDQLKSYEKYN